MSDIIVIGSYNRDTLMQVDRFPAPGETLKITNSRVSHGGKGSNQAVQAARFGARVAMLGCVGDDAYGLAALAMWKQEEIGTDMVATINDCPTGSAVILVAGGGENMILVDGGANEHLLPGSIALHADRIAHAKVIVAQLETPVQATHAAFKLAREAGVITILNAAPASRDLNHDILNWTDILVVNEIEAAMLMDGKEPSANRPGAVDQLLEKVACGVLLTLGAKGALYFGCNGQQIAPESVRITVVDTTGAGDALIGAFAAILASCGSAEEALAFGVAAGTYACLSSGAAASYGTKEQVIERCGSPS